jgi:TetR/AcrR family transcriptional repressor of nem operon
MPTQDEPTMRDYTQLSPAAERIVDVAEALIQRQGFNGFSYEDIAQTVGIRKPSVHHHFATKADLATVVTQRYVQRFSDALDSLDQQALSPRERLLSYARLFQDTYQHNRRLCLCGMLGAEQETLPESVRAHLQRFFDLNLQWLSASLAQAWPDRSAQAKHLALLLLSALEGSMVVGRHQTEDDAPMQVAQAFLNQLET